MPTYCFTTDGGETVERQCRMGKAPRWVRVSGAVARRDVIAEHAHMHSGDPYPLISEGMGVLPHQIEEAERLAHKHGVNTEYVKDAKHPGAAIIRSREHRVAHMKAFGHYDQDAGYGDRTPSYK